MYRVERDGEFDRECSRVKTIRTLLLLRNCYGRTTNGKSNTNLLMIYYVELYTENIVTQFSFIISKTRLCSKSAQDPYRNSGPSPLVLRGGLCPAVERVWGRMMKMLLKIK